MNALESDLQLEPVHKDPTSASPIPSTRSELDAIIRMESTVAFNELIWAYNNRSNSFLKSSITATLAPLTLQLEDMTEKLSDITAQISVMMTEIHTNRREITKLREVFSTVTTLLLTDPEFTNGLVGLFAILLLISLRS